LVVLFEWLKMHGTTNLKLKDVFRSLSFTLFNWVLVLYEDEWGCTRMLTVCRSWLGTRPSGDCPYRRSNSSRPIVTIHLIELSFGALFMQLY
jgi:hypothetical protein